MIFEIKKLLRRKELWIVFGLVLLMTVLLSFREYHVDRKLAVETRKKVSAYYNMKYSDAIPAIKQELEQFSIEKSSSRFQEFQALHSLLFFAESMETHESNVKKLLSRMNNDITNASDQFTIRDLKKAVRLYNRAYHYHVCDQSVLFSLFMNAEYTTYFEWLYLLLLCTLLSPLFTIEEESGMYQILFSSKSGKSGLFYKKVCAGVVCILLFAALYSAIVFSVLWIKYGISPLLLTTPLQTVELYRNCPYQINILGYIVLYALMRTLVGVFMLAIIVCISCLLKKTLAVFSISMFFSALLMLPSFIFSYDPVKMRLFQHIGVTRLFYLREYIMQYNTVNVFGYPVGQLILAATCTCCLSLFLIITSYLHYSHKNTRHESR